MMDRGEADICAAACEGTHATAGRHALKEVASHRQPTQERVPGRILQPWKGVHTGTGFLAGTVAPGEPTLEESVSDGLYPLQRTQAAAVLQVLQAVGGAQSRALNEVSYGKDPTGAREQLQGQGTAEKKCNIYNEKKCFDVSCPH